jgi:protein-L-isoaspartate(D-aspartate) O-methyltransferase
MAAVALAIALMGSFGLPAACGALQAAAPAQRPPSPQRRPAPTPRQPTNPRLVGRYMPFSALRQPQLPPPPPPPPPFGPPPFPGFVPAPRRMAIQSYDSMRRSMVNQQLRQRGISQPEVLAAMEQVPRHLFLPPTMRGEAYADRALQLGPSRTIYQPYVVALMTSLLDLKRGDSVLEVGTGTGYHAAVLSRIAHHVYSMEIDPVVASQAAHALGAMGYHNVQVWSGDGYRGLPEKAPFDAILLSAAPPRIPQPLLDQLRVGGKMVVPVGGVVQDLLVITKTKEGIEKRTVIPVRVSPMTGQVQDGH